MEPKEIVAYLRGAINLGKITSLSAQETSTFKSHLQKVKSFEDNKEKQFCAWFAGFLDCLETNDVQPEKFLKIAQKLNEIENTYDNGLGVQLGQRLPGGAIAKC